MAHGSLPDSSIGYMYGILCCIIVTIVFKTNDLQSRHIADNFLYICHAVLSQFTCSVINSM